MTIVAARIGNVAVVPDWLDGARITRTTSRIAVEPGTAVPRFVRVGLDGPVEKRDVSFCANGAGQPTLTFEHAEQFSITRPPSEQPSRIAGHLESILGGFDSFEPEAERAFELLKKRRVAPISAAVTGMIDVWQFAFQEAA